MNKKLTVALYDNENVVTIGDFELRHAKDSPSIICRYKDQKYTVSSKGICVDMMNAIVEQFKELKRSGNNTEIFITDNKHDHNL